MKRATVVVLDACGVGELPDAAEYEGDIGSNTLVHLAEQVDPTAPHTDHTREYAPLLATWQGCDGRRHDGLLADVGASVLSWVTGGGAAELPGEAFV